MARFNRQVSNQLDAVVFLLDMHLPLLVRLALRYLKRRIERGIP